MVKKAGPVIKTAPVATHGAGGIPCFCCRCFTCIHIEFLKTLPGMVKASEVVINFIIQGLLLKYGLLYHAQIGSAFEGALTTSSACFLNSSILLLCYMCSEKSYKLIQSSQFEMIFNFIACCFCLSSASCLGFATTVFLWPLYIITPGFYVYPAMTTAYYLSGVVGVLYGIDTYFAYIEYRG
ncbi:protein singles bar-like [Copidosoma floridanum]|uniref:protein singles bar-like n=1 Tax=Copidosoma floridanum TaxID=29053 RepID=UPI0006C9DA8F|nr:protein singles bar-like [Copidosoma floridanum]